MGRLEGSKNAKKKKSGKEIPEPREESKRETKK
jgi:hypothetical protein